MLQPFNQKSLQNITNVNLIVAKCGWQSCGPTRRSDHACRAQLQIYYDSRLGMLASKTHTSQEALLHTSLVTQQSHLDAQQTRERCKQTTFQLSCNVPSQHSLLTLLRVWILELPFSFCKTTKYSLSTAPNLHRRLPSNRLRPWITGKHHKNCFLDIIVGCLLLGGGCPTSPP